MTGPRSERQMLNNPRQSGAFRLGLNRGSPPRRAANRPTPRMGGSGIPKSIRRGGRYGRRSSSWVNLKLTSRPVCAAPKLRQSWFLVSFPAMKLGEARPSTTAIKLSSGQRLRFPHMPPAPHCGGTCWRIQPAIALRGPLKSAPLQSSSTCGAPHSSSNLHNELSSVPR